MAVATELVRVVAGRLVPIAGVWEFDRGHTEVSFEGRHLKVNLVRGRFAKFAGRLIVAEIPEQSTAELVIEAASLESGFSDRDSHLRSADWFDVERYPTIAFRSQAIEHVAGNLWKATGELTIKGLKRLIGLEVEFGGATMDPWGSGKIGALVKTEVDLAAWGMTWNLPLGAGGFVVDRTVSLRVGVEATYKGPHSAPAEVPAVG